MIIVKVMIVGRHHRIGVAAASLLGLSFELWASKVPVGVDGGNGAVGRTGVCRSSLMDVVSIIVLFVMAARLVLVDSSLVVRGLGYKL